jgi:hypothetical protein
MYSWVTAAESLLPVSGLYGKTLSLVPGIIITIKRAISTAKSKK